MHKGDGALPFRRTRPGRRGTPDSCRDIAYCNERYKGLRCLIHRLCAHRLLQ